MNDAMNSADVIEAGMNAWNTLTELMDGGEATFDHPAEFREFYGLVLERLFEEETA